MAITKIFNGVNILKPGYYGDPFDVHPDTIPRHHNDISAADANALIEGLRALHRTLRIFKYLKAFHNEHETTTDLRIYYQLRPNTLRDL